jgi:hypothetical protein
MYTQYAETLLKNVAKAVNNLKYDIEVAKKCITAFHPQVQKSGNHTIFYKGKTRKGKMIKNMLK